VRRLEERLTRAQISSVLSRTSHMRTRFARCSPRAARIGRSSQSASRCRFCRAQMARGVHALPPRAKRLHFRRQPKSRRRSAPATRACQTSLVPPEHAQLELDVIVRRSGTLEPIHRTLRNTERKLFMFRNGDALHRHVERRPRLNATAHAAIDAAFTDYVLARPLRLELEQNRRHLVRQRHIVTLVGQTIRKRNRRLRHQRPRPPHGPLHLPSHKRRPRNLDVHALAPPMS